MRVPTKAWANLCQHWIDGYKRGGWGRSSPCLTMQSALAVAGQRCPGASLTGHRRGKVGSPNSLLPRGSAPATCVVIHQSIPGNARGAGFGSITCLRPSSDATLTESWSPAIHHRFPPSRSDFLYAATQTSSRPAIHSSRPAPHRHKREQARRLPYESLANSVSVAAREAWPLASALCGT